MARVSNFALVTKPGGPLAARHGYWIVGAAAVGLLFASALVGLVALGCGYWGDRAFWKGVAASPPWVLFTGAAAAPAVLLTWYWRTVQREWELSLQHLERRQTESTLEEAAVRSFETAVSQFLSSDLGATSDAIDRSLAAAYASPDLQLSLARRLATFLRDVAPMRAAAKGPALVSYNEAVTTALRAIYTLRTLHPGLQIDLSGSDLSALQFKGVNLRGIILNGATIVKADLRGAIGLDGIQLYRVGDYSGAVYDETTDVDAFGLELLQKQGVLSTNETMRTVYAAFLAKGIRADALAVYLAPEDAEAGKLPT